MSVDRHDPQVGAAAVPAAGHVVVFVAGVADGPRRGPGAAVEGDRPAVRSGPVCPTIFLAQVEEDKVVKNRSHFDVSPVDVSQQDEDERILALGATHADVGQTGDESWTVLADPEGNEFCVLRSLAPGHFSL